VEVVRPLQSPIRCYVVQNSRAKIPADIRRPWAKFVATYSGIDERPKRTATRQVNFPVRRKLIGVQGASNLHRKVVIPENTFRREVSRGNMHRNCEAWTNMEAGYWPPAAGIPAFKMEVAAAKMCAALWLGISFSAFSQCWM